MRYAIIFAGFAALAAQPVAAASTPAPPAHSQKVDPAALAAADHMLTAMGYERMMQRTSDALVAQMGPMFKKAIEEKTGEEPDDALIKQLTGIESDFMHKILLDSPDVRHAIALIYANEFTAPELNHLVELYSDPVMHKWTDVAPDMTAQMLPLIEGVAQSHRAEIQEKIMTAVINYYASKKPTPDS